MTRRVGDSIVNVAKRDRRIAELLHVPILSVPEIARAVGVGADTVRRKLRAIEEIRRVAGLDPLRPSSVHARPTPHPARRPPPRRPGRPRVC